MDDRRGNAEFSSVRADEVLASINVVAAILQTTSSSGLLNIV
jgi:hypothetical protein